MHTKPFGIAPNTTLTNRLTNMLCIIFSKKKLLAGVKTDIPQLLKISGKSHISYEGRQMQQVLGDHLTEICKAYQQIMEEQGNPVKGNIPVSLAFPVDIINKQADKVQIFEVLKQASEPGLEVIHEENLVISFLYGLKNQDELPELNSVLLEAIDDYLHLCYHTHGEKEEVDTKEMGAAALHTDERFSFEAIKDFGRSSGNEQVLNELLKEFSSAGLTVDVKGQTDLALQMTQVSPGNKHLYKLSKTTPNVSIEAEIQLSHQRHGELMTIGRDKLKSFLSASVLEEKGIDKVILLGSFLKTESLREFFSQDLELDGKLISMDGGSEYDEFAAIVEGLTIRTEEVLEAEEIRKIAEQKRKEEEAKRAKIEAELQVKDNRESLLAELQATCVDPGRREEYEEMFVNRGIQLGIPDVVIKWNISEVLGRIELQQEAATVGTEEVDDSSDDSPANEVAAQEEAKHETPVSPSNSGTSNGHVSAHQETETLALVAEPQVDTQPQNQLQIETEVSEEIEEAIEEAVSEAVEEMEETTTTAVEEPAVEEPGAEEEGKEEESASEDVGEEGAAAPEVTEENLVVEEAAAMEELKEEVAEEEVAEEEKEAESKAEEVKEEIETVEKKEETKEVKKKETAAKEETKEEQGKDRPKVSLNDVFLIKGSLPDPEFSTKRVTFHADQEVRVVRVLGLREQEDEAKVAAFNKLYEKELKYYENLSEISEAKEGTYYYRPFFERHTLADHIKKAGLDSKKRLEDLSSTDLKFILQVFKEVQELPVSHANLSEENILILAKRKWNLQKNMEIKFVGFTSEEATKEEMIEQTHAVFAKLMGKKLYQDFRSKFQL